jgi:acyl-coenzyme A thioesterase PaaI-like protein
MPTHDKSRDATPSDDASFDASAPASTAGTDEPGRERAFFEYWNQMDMLSWMGARITESADGHATVSFQPGEHHRGAGVGGRAVTGAVQAYIFDIVTGAAVASLAHGTRPQVTVKLDVTFEHPAYDAPLTFEGHVLSGGRQIFFVEGLCRDANGRVCSRAHAIYRRFDKRLHSLPELEARLKANAALAEEEVEKEEGDRG